MVFLIDEAWSSRMYPIMFGKCLGIFFWCLAGHIISVNVYSVLMLVTNFPVSLGFSSLGLVKELLSSVLH